MRLSNACIVASQGQDIVDRPLQTIDITEEFPDALRIGSVKFVSLDVETERCEWRAELMREIRAEGSFPFHGFVTGRGCRHECTLDRVDLHDAGTGPGAKLAAGSDHVGVDPQLIQRSSEAAAASRREQTRGEKNTECECGHRGPGPVDPVGDDTGRNARSDRADHRFLVADRERDDERGPVALRAAAMKRRFDRRIGVDGAFA